MRKLNQHLPKNRKSLDKLLCEKEPYVELADGNRHYFKQKDLALASDLVPRDQRNKIMLPIVVVRRVEFGEGTYIVLGGKAEKQIILTVLELADTMYGSKELFIYKPHIQKLLKELGSLITIGFDIPIRY